MEIPKRKYPEPLYIWEVDVDGTNYVIDENGNIFNGYDHFNDYNFENITADGIMKDNIETATEHYFEESGAKFVDGKEALIEWYNVVMSELAWRETQMNKLLRK